MRLQRRKKFQLERKTICIISLSSVIRNLEDTHIAHMLASNECLRDPDLKLRMKGQNKTMSKALATKNVAAVLLATALVIGFTFSFAKPAKADTLSTLQSQVQALLAQIAALQGSGTATTSGACFTFTQDESQGSTGGQVMWVQEFLNGHGFTVAASGAGSPGNETSYFGALTKSAVAKWQAAEGVSPAVGYWGPISRAKANSICASQGTGTGTGTGTTPTGPGISVTAGAQPANSLAPTNATRVPFTTFTLTNNSGAAVTVTGIAIQRTGLAADNAFAGVVLLDSNGIQLGNAQTFNSNHQATVGGTFTLQNGQSMTYTVAGNMSSNEINNAGQVASISVIGVNTTVPVTGTLPITGASQTINASLTIGTATVGNSGFDPNGTRNEAIGTTGVTFSAVRITANTEDQKLYSITWNETGSAGTTDISNLATVVNGTSYPVTVDASGKYYTSTFPGGILITKGNSADAYIKGDITGSNASSRTVEFDIYRASDIYLVGQTYGYGVLPTTSTSGGSFIGSGSNTNSGFQASTNPFYFGAEVKVTGGTLSTVSTASTVSPQNIAVNVPNQVLGGFTTNFTGEPVTVQSLTVHVASTTGATQLQNVTLVDSNGNVVGGPNDETIVTPGTIVFNSSITFPVGAMTYTIKGTVSSPLSPGANNGTTYTLSTNPFSDWSSPVGQTSGSNLTLTNSTITMSTMTVQSGQLTISASATPAATTITTNQNNYTIANIVLNASQSGEDVRLNSLPIVVDATGTGSTAANVTATNTYALENNLTNCQLWNGSSVLNSQAVGAGQWTAQTVTANAALGGGTAGIETNFVFNNQLVVPKGTTLQLALICNVGGSLTNGEQFAAGVDTLFKPTVSGALSGNNITPTVNTTTSGVQTVGTASLSITTPTQIYAQAAGGTVGVTLGSFTLQPTSGQVSLQNIALELNTNTASSSDLDNGAGDVSIWNGSTQVGTVNFLGGTQSSNFLIGTSTVSLTLPQNVQTTLTIKGNISTIGSGSSGTSGHEILIGLNNANGSSGNTSVNTGVATQPNKGSGVAIFRSYPTQVSLVGLPASGVSGDRNLIEFSVQANSQNPLGIVQFAFSFASSTGVTITNPALYYSDGGTPNTAVNNGVANATSYNVVTQSATTTLVTPLEIPAGHTYNFLLQAGTIAYTGGNSTYNITTTLKGDSADLAPTMLAANAAATTTNDFIWSPNSTTTTAASVADWSNGYGVNGLPSFGISSSRAQ